MKNKGQIIEDITKAIIFDVLEDNYDYLFIYENGNWELSNDIPITNEFYNTIRIKDILNTGNKEDNLKIAIEIALDNLSSQSKII